MNFWFGLYMGLKEIWDHKFRSFLTMLGVILGVASLLAMFALVEGIANGMREIMQATGGLERVQVVPKDVSEHLQDLAFLSPGRTMRDVEGIRKGVPLVDLVSPEANLGGAAITRGNVTIRLNVTGGTPEFAEMGKYELARGRMITHLDLENAHHVVVLGHSVVQSLFGDPQYVDPVGQTILINQRPFKVVGTFPLFETEEARLRREAGVTDAVAKRRKERGSNKASRAESRRWDPFFMKNNAIVIPLTTMFYEFKSATGNGADDKGPDYKLDRLYVRIADLTRFNEALTQIRNVLDQTHRGIDDFGFDTREDWFDSIESGVRATRASGGIIAGISLLVGGIGIMNIMLASITERIREIGVRRAVGARSRDIFIQILAESSAIGVIGGLLGLAAALGLIELIIVFSPTENAPIVTFSSILISFSSAVLIGVLSGIYPALRASRLDPIEALRYG